MTDFTESPGYKSLMEAGERNPEDDRNKKAVDWALKRCKHYAEKTGLSEAEILNSWEENRNYWHVNYYQEANQPLIVSENVHVFDTPEEAKEAFGKEGFRCPACKGVSKNPYECDTGLEMNKGKKCDWKSWGLFQAETYVFIKSKVKGTRIFTPIAWEENIQEEDHRTAPGVHG